MSDKLITISFPQGDDVAAHHFGEALIRMAAALTNRDYPVIGEETSGSHEHTGADVLSVTVPASAYEKLANGESVGLSVGAILPPLQEEKTADVPPPPVPVAEPEPTEYAPGQNIYMIDPADVDIRVVSKFAERDQLLADGWRIVSKEELATFDRKEAGHSGDLDKEGYPWDERIHSGSKAKVKDGTWRLRKTPADQTAEQWQAYVASIKAELKMPETAEQGDDFNTDAGEVTEQEVAGLPPIAPPVLSAEPPANLPAPDQYTGPTTFPELMSFMCEHMGAVQPHLAILCSRAKISTVRDLMVAEKDIPAFYQDMVNTAQL